ncbi:hypothetical protein EYM_00045 [Ignicoccus islandicus DSM 13165]|uniref:Uncharacterized protein n=1 Tax=Ignicoccus islandicus DSM 13165 TaxID=940295 RepID=A0A0U3F7T5_9CREN|nr:hypothetical protein [Ignicoccus islandicus]ALU12088.1 hypothetical protein EYM_00045 [Ignicoccus islandicus DSM 13165]
MEMQMDLLVEYTIRLATHMRIRDELNNLDYAQKEVAEKVAKLIVSEKRGLKYCSICAKGPYTKRGLYLHFMRVHKDDVKALLLQELEMLPRNEESETVKNSIEVAREGVEA